MAAILSEDCLVKTFSTQLIFNEVTDNCVAGFHLGDLKSGENWIGFVPSSAKFFAADRRFDDFDVPVATPLKLDVRLVENDGESTYEIALNGKAAARFKSPILAIGFSCRNCDVTFSNVQVEFVDE